jgi:hypothetical protein
MDDHRRKMGLKKGPYKKKQKGSDIVVDHINKKKSDNRKKNLRKMTRSEHLRRTNKGNKNAAGRHNYPKRSQKA